LRRGKQRPLELVSAKPHIHEEVPMESVLVIPILALLIPIILVPTTMILKHRHKRREWEHLERMKEMEERLPASPAQALTKARGVAAIGAGVPVASVLGAWMTSVTCSPELAREELPTVAWGCALLISTCAMITSLLLARMQARALKEMETVSNLDGKPLYDPDAFDVVSRRG
jgi:hypothetical protein